MFLDRARAVVSAGSVLVLVLLSSLVSSGGGMWVDVASAFGPAAWTAYGISRTEREYRRLS